jgi:hypothetical protein
MPRTLTDQDRAAVVQNIRHTKIVDASRRLARIVKHVDPDAKTKAARTRLEKDLPRWLRFHGGEAFNSPWSPDHEKVLAKIATAMNKGGLFSLAMPRGGGKSTILKWVTAYVLLTGRRKYVVVIAATAEMAQAIVDFIRQQITESDTLHAHYPQVTTYARATDGKAIKARYQLRADGKASGILWSKTTLVFPEVVSPDGKPYASNGAILEAHGLTGAIRGKWKDTKTGKVLRPDFVILDDPQDRSSAESPSQCAMRERIITGDVLGLAGPKKRIAAVMPCTIIRKGDLADRFLDHKLHPEWQGEVCKLVNKWPDAQDTLWKDYERIYREETGEGRGFVKATEFYEANKSAMDAGAEVSWKHRVRDGETSALQTAENLLIETGPQFWAEYQNDPQDIVGSQYELTVEMILQHAVNIPRLHLPPQITVLCGHVDINRAGLHWCLAGFDQSMTGHSPLYGKHPQRGDLWRQNAPDMERKQAIFHGLKAVCDSISATSFMRGGTQAIRPGLILIDLGYEADVVHRFCNTAAYPFRVLPSAGRAAHKYFVKRDALIGRPFENCHVQKSDNGPYLVFNADAWRETMQRAFLADPGAPGGLTLHAAPDRYHVPFAEHVIAEKLCNKYETAQGLRWEWRHQPGASWDWGDALTGCWVAGAASGLSASGQPVATPAPTRNMRQVRHIAI